MRCWDLSKPASTEPPLELPSLADLGSAAWVLACSAEGQVADVTRRYCERWTGVVAAEAPWGRAGMPWSRAFRGSR